MLNYNYNNVSLSHRFLFININKVNNMDIKTIIIIIINKTKDNKDNIRFKENYNNSRYI